MRILFITVFTALALIGIMLLNAMGEITIDTQVIATILLLILGVMLAMKFG